MMSAARTSTPAASSGSLPNNRLGHSPLLPDLPRRHGTGSILATKASSNSARRILCFTAVICMASSPMRFAR
jgi:hypothetical protein